jgi:hypothetical protein
MCVSDWIMESFLEATLHNKDINLFSADGALNAIGPIAEYESLSCPTHPNDVQLSVYFLHQHEQSVDMLLGPSHLLYLQTRN